MKLLFDQNLSPRLVRLLTTEFPGSEHVRNVGLAAAPDPAVWTYAAAQGLVIVSKDSDFQHRALLLGHPPKVVWVRLGNCSTGAAVALLPTDRPTCLRSRLTLPPHSWPFRNRPDGGRLCIRQWSLMGWDNSE